MGGNKEINRHAMHCIYVLNKFILLWLVTHNDYFTPTHVKVFDSE